MWVIWNKGHYWKYAAERLLGCLSNFVISEIIKEGNGKTIGALYKGTYQ